MLTALLLTFAPAIQEESPPDTFVHDLLSAHPDRFGRFLADPETYKLQILVAVPEGDKGLVRHGYRLDAEYFYPASSIKTIAAVAAVHYLVELRAKGSPVDIDTPLRFHPLFDDEELEERDESNLDGGRITVRHELRKLFLVSDNRAYNRLYELLGHDRINRMAWDWGLPTVRLHHRLSESRSLADNRRTPRVDFLISRDRVHRTGPLTSELTLHYRDVPGLRVGEAQIADGERVERPFDFRYKNAISIRDLQELNVVLLSPAWRSAGLALVHEVMPQYPSQSKNPAYDAEDYPDHWGKWLLPGLEQVIPKKRLRIYNKVGRAYGFSTENAFVEDVKTGRSFYVTAALYTNPNRTVNDGVYGYEEIADPFFADLGEVLGRELLAD